MNERRHRSVQVRSFSPEDQEKLLEETILQWRALGPAAAWKAIYDILGWWFAARGLDPEAQRVDRTHIEIRPVSWLKRDATAADAGDRAPSKETTRA
jgi:hypothetical protein